MTDLNTMTERSPQLIGAFTFYEYGTPDWVRTEMVPEEFLGSILNDKTFTRSNGTIVSRLYERLTKASRRRQPVDFLDARTVTTAELSQAREEAYRNGIYDAYKALQEELS